MIDSKTNKHLKVLFILPFFHAGGVERWVSYAYNSLKSNGVNVKIFCFGDISVSHSFFCNDVVVDTASIYDICKYLLKNDVVCITALSKSNFFFSLFNSISRNIHISTVHLSLSKKSFENFFKYKARLFLHKFIAVFSNLTITVSKGVEKELRLISNNSNITTIYNPCFHISDISPLRNFDVHGPIKFIAAGRLHHQKRFDILIEAFSSVYELLPPESSLTIWGDGDDRKSLESMIPKQLSNYITLPGKTNSLFSEYKKSDVFILSSEYEGFGNVLVEALANGCQCISFNIPHGPKEILNNGNYGLLVDFTIDDLKKSIVSLSNGTIEQKNNSTSLMPHLLNFTSEKFKEDLLFQIYKLI